MYFTGKLKVETEKYWVGEELLHYSPSAVRL